MLIFGAFIRDTDEKMADSNTKMQGKNSKFAVMRWLTDGDRLSVHDLYYVSSPKLPVDEYKPGTCGLSVYVGFPGLWKFRILNVGGKNFSLLAIRSVFDLRSERRSR